LLPVVFILGGFLIEGNTSKMLKESYSVRIMFWESPLIVRYCPDAVQENGPVGSVSVEIDFSNLQFELVVQETDQSVGKISWN